MIDQENDKFRKKLSQKMRYRRIGGNAFFIG